MSEQTSTWRVGDGLAAEQMRNLAAQVCSLLLDHPSTTLESSESVAERVRHEVLLLDGFDRAAVAAMTEQLSLQLRGLQAGR